jgi:hypothetical protein
MRYGMRTLIMKKILFFLSLFPVVVSTAEPISSNDYFKNIFSVFAGKNVIRSDWDALIERFNQHCHPSEKSNKEQYKAGNVECDKKTEITRLFIVARPGDGISSIKADISGVEKCSYIIRTLRSNFGQPKKTIDTCVMKWDLNPAKKGGERRMISIEDNKERNLIYFSFEEEAGP